MFVEKVTKGHCRNYYDIHMLDAPVNPAIGHLLTPIHELSAIWIAKGWEEVPENFIKGLGSW